MEYILKNSDQKPFLYSKNNIVVEVNNELINITGYSNNELIGKSLAEMSNILRIDSQVSLENIENEYSCYMFTKEYEPKEVTISCKRLKDQSEKTYFINKKVNSDIKEKFEYVEHLYLSNEMGVALYSLPDLIVLKMNDKYLEFVNNPYNKKETVIGKKSLGMMFGCAGSNEGEVLLSNVKTGKPSFQKEFKYEHFERGTTYWNISLVPICIDGKAKYLIETTTDETENVINREIIEKQKEELDIITDNISDQLMIINKNGDDTMLNQINKDNTLYDFITLKNSKAAFEQAEYFDMNEKKVLYENMPVQRVIRGEKISGDILIIKNKTNTIYTEVTGIPIYDKEGDFTRGIMIYKDITTRIQNEKNSLLKIQYNALNAIVENLDMGFIIASYPEFNIEYINNKSCSRLKSINPEIELSKVIGKSVFQNFKYSIDEKTKLELHVQELIEKKSNSCFYYKKHIEKGEEKFYKIMCQTIIGLSDTVTEVILLTMDITKELKDNNKMEETLKIQDEIFSNISHELKTPLNLIFSTNQLLDFYSRNDLLQVNIKQVSKSINIIKQNCYRFTKIIDNIIDISKMESGYFKLNLFNENIVDIIENIVDSVAEHIEGKGLNIIFDTNTEEKIIACDPYKIDRIILNLISNAIKFSKPEGSIFVEIFDHGDTVEILVRDNGIGMEKKYLDSIFKRFHQIDKSLSRNAEGCGIGLSIVKSLVELHDGKISAESKLDEGSIFKVEFPVIIVDNPKVLDKRNPNDSKIEMINIEFSDLYSIQ